MKLGIIPALALLCLSAGSAFGQTSGFTLTSNPNPSNVGQTVTLTASPVPSLTTVTFYDTTQSGTVTQTATSGTTSNGPVSIQTSFTTAGTHQLVACYRFSSDSGQGGQTCSNTVFQQVNALPSSLFLTSSQNPSAPCASVTFTATVSPSAATGSVSFFDGTTPLGSPTLSGGSASVTVPSLTLGNHNIQARYVPDSSSGYGPSQNNIVQVVNGSATVTLSSTPNPSNFSQPVTISAAVAPLSCSGTPPPTTSPTGTVTFYDGTTQIGQSGIVSGTASTSTSTLGIGNHSLSATYSGDSNFGSATSNVVTQVVNPGKTNTTTSLSTSANPITTTQPLTLTASVVPSGATGQVQFKDGGAVIGTSTLSGGTATLTLSSLTAGVHALTAVYLGDTNFNSSTSNTVSETVNPPGKTNTTTSLSTSANPIATGQPLTLTASVTPAGATGQVQFSDGGSPIATVTLANGGASFTTSSLAAGNHSLSASYLGDANFNPSTSQTINEAVNPPTNQPTTTSLSVAPNPANLGQAVVMTATVAPSTATGTVTFTDNGSALGTGTLANGAASFSTSSLAAGSHTIVAVYGGNTTFNSSSSNAVTLVVNKTNTTTSLSVSSNPASSGQPVTLTASVSPAGATGQVQFSDGGTLLGTVTLTNGVASFTTSALSTGSNSVSATYSGDANFNPSTSQTINVVVSVTNQPTSTSLSVSPNPVSPGQLVVLTATVTPSAATGVVTFFDNGSLLGTSTLFGGVATFSTSSLAAGTHLLVARYGGSASFVTSSSSPVTLVVNTTTTVPGTQTTLSTSPNPSTFGQPVSLNATVTAVNIGGIPTGTITFSDGTTTLGIATLNGGGASFTTSTLSVGTHSLSAAYSGDGTFNASNSLPVNQQVNKATSTISLSASPTSISPGQGVLLTAKVTPSTATGTVTFSDGTATIGPVPVVAGSASTTTSSLTTPGNHSLTATYSGDANVLGSSSSPVTVTVSTTPILTPTTTSLSASPTTSAVGQAVSLTATVAPAGATGSVTFLDGSATLGTQSLSSGTATLSTSSLSAGSHSLTAVYSGDSKFATSSSPAVTETVTGKNNSTTSLSVSPNPGSTGQPVTLTATVTPASATGTVTFLDGGNVLGPGTLSGGSATLTTSSLSTGSHTLTASYAGDTNTNGSTSTAVTEIINGTALGSISPTALPTAIVGVPYSQTLTVTGGTPPLSWTLASGSVPGLTLSSAGILSGTPTTAGTTSLTVRVQDSSSPASATAAVLSLTVLPLPSPSISSPTVASTSDQPAPQVTLSPAFTVALTATFTLSFTPNASNLPANYVNPDVKFIGGSTTSAPVNIPANSTAPVTLPAIQVGTVAGTITVKLATLTTSSGQSVLPANLVTASITLGRLAPVIVPGSVKITNITSTGFSVFLDASSTPRDLTSASLTFTAASGTQLNGATETVSLSTPATTWFGSTPGVTNGGAFSVTMQFAYSGDPTAIGTVSVTLTNSVGTSAAVSGGR